MAGAVLTRLLVVVGDYQVWMITSMTFTHANSEYVEECMQIDIFNLNCEGWAFNALVNWGLEVLIWQFYCNV